MAAECVPVFCGPGGRRMSGRIPPVRHARLICRLVTGDWVVSIFSILIAFGQASPSAGATSHADILATARNPVPTGTRLSLMCTPPASLMQAAHHVEYRWYTMRPGQHGATSLANAAGISYRDGNRVLTIVSVGLENIGTYRCNVVFFNSQGARQISSAGSRAITVITQEQLLQQQPKLQLAVQRPHGVIAPGTTVHFYCIPKNADNVQWLIDGQPLTDTHFYLKRGSKNQTLACRNLSPADQGKVITCIATASSGKNATTDFPPIALSQPATQANQDTAEVSTSSHATEIHTVRPAVTSTVHRQSRAVDLTSVASKRNTRPTATTDIAPSTTTTITNPAAHFLRVFLELNASCNTDQWTPELQTRGKRLVRKQHHCQSRLTGNFHHRPPTDKTQHCNADAGNTETGDTTSPQHQHLSSIWEAIIDIPIQVSSITTHPNDSTVETLFSCIRPYIRLQGQMVKVRRVCSPVSSAICISLSTSAPSHPATPAISALPTSEQNLTPPNNEVHQPTTELIQTSNTIVVETGIEDKNSKNLESDDGNDTGDTGENDPENAAEKITLIIFLAMGCVVIVVCAFALVLVVVARRSSPPQVPQPQQVPVLVPYYSTIANNADNNPRPTSTSSQQPMLPSE
ncbi:uncharacterized protein LOC135809399 isoform X1 [Sycon ciliatum]|uniref:uncharacterized protein LOC135809399 isoform X1 n=1 Tax=Sycon ciliatum TaxID=27933 RepID=UPI0031F65894